MSEIGNSLLN